MKDRLELQQISFHYSGIATSPYDILRDVSLTFDQTQCAAIVGQSGAGKTTLIQHFTGLLRPTSGSIRFNGTDIWSKGFKQSVLRRKIGLVFQFPENQLFEETVESDIAFGPKNYGLSEHEIDERILQAMQAVELPEAFRKRSPFRLSEGEKRRVAIAGVLAMQPDMLIFDEPTAGLDPRAVQRFVTIVQRLLQMQKSIIIVTHNMDFVAEVATRVIVLQQGSVVFDGLPHTLFANSILLENAGLESPTVVRSLRAFGKPLPQEFKDIISYGELSKRAQAYFAQT